MASGSTAGFDCLGQSYVTLSSDGRVKVWDVATGNVALEHTSRVQLTDQYTCLGWGPLEAKHSASASAAPSKRKRRRSVSGQQVNSLVLARVSGTVVTLSLATGETVELTSGHKESATAVEWCDDTKLFSAAKDKTICVWNVKTKKVTKRLATKDIPTALKANASGSRLLTAARVIRVWDVDAGTVLKELVGHNNTVSQLQWLPQGSLFVSHAKDETVMSVWDSAGDETLAVANYSVPGTAVASTVLPHGVGNKQRYRIGVATGDGQALIFEQPGKKGVTKPQKFKAKIEVMDTEGEASIDILGAGFTLPRDGHAPKLLVVYGAQALPMFDEVTYHADGDETNMTKHTVLKRRADIVAQNGGSVNINGKQGMQEAQQRREQAKAVQARSDAASAAMPTPALNKQAVDTLERMTPSDNRTIEERLKELEVTGGDADVGGSGRVRTGGDAPQAHSLLQLLVQALHSDDSQLLEECLAQTNETVVRNTVKRLPTSYVVPFLTQVVDRFEAKPSRGIELTVWIRFVLLLHTSYLMTVPDLMKHLSGLYQLIDTRLSAFKKLMKLSGRLDLVLTQIAERGETGNTTTFDDLQEPEAIYEEEMTDSEDDEGTFEYSDGDDEDEDASQSDDDDNDETMDE